VRRLFGDPKPEQLDPAGWRSGGRRRCTAHGCNLRTVFATGEVQWAWSEDLVARLAAFRPDVYAAWDVELLARNLRALGIETKQLNRTGPDGVRFSRAGSRSSNWR
jgi:hypothetical protein